MSDVAWREEAALLLQEKRALASEVAVLKEDAERYYRIMDALRDADRFRGKHGRCKPREDRACSACNASIAITEMVAAYKGRRIVLAASAGGSDHPAALPEVTK